MELAYLDFERERDRDSERLEAREGLGERDRLCDLTRAGLRGSDLDGDRDSCCHRSILTTLLQKNTPCNLIQEY